MKIINKFILIVLLLSGGDLISELWPASDSCIVFSFRTESVGGRTIAIGIYKCRPRKLNDGTISYTVLKQKTRGSELISSEEYEKTFSSDKSVTVHDVLPEHAYERLDDEKSY